jgi:hypothetical protein
MGKFFYNNFIIKNNKQIRLSLIPKIQTNLQRRHTQQPCIAIQ